MPCSCAAYRLSRNPNVVAAPSYPLPLPRLGLDPDAVRVPQARPLGCYGSLVPARAFGCRKLSDAGARTAATA